MDVRVGERLHRVDVRADGGDWVVTIDGQVRRASLSRAGAGWSLLLADGRQDDGGCRRSYEVSFERGSAADVIVHVNAARVTVSLPYLQAGLVRRRRGSAGGTGAGQIVAPMPGRVVSVLVEPGDLVVERQAVVVLEAMKMQNEVRTARGGVVKEVRVAGGAAVEAGAVLVVIDNPASAGG
jgi:3-methylcrotonyl-CoA carboxylase alpha subunit